MDDSPHAATTALRNSGTIIVSISKSLSVTMLLTAARMIRAKRETAR
jgi:hypothetical protein